ncbi:MAG: peroxiredoxin [Actinomycetes bacterium]
MALTVAEVRQSPLRISALLACGAGLNQQTGAMALVVGAVAPDFTLEGWADGQVRSFTLSEQRGRPVALIFYPGDERLICTRQMCSYSDGMSSLRRHGAAVWGIAPQDVDSHRSFAEGRHLTMPLLADTGRSVAQAFAVVGPRNIRRSVFVLDADGRVAWRHVSALNISFPSVEDISGALEAVAA